MQPLTLAIIDIISRIPAGKVVTYGQVAAMAGNHRAARQVSRVLHSCTEKHQLPWHRVSGSIGKITIPIDRPGHSVQKKKLQLEGIEFGLGDTIDLSIYQWSGSG